MEVRTELRSWCWAGGGVKVYGARRGESGPTGHGASMGFIMVMVNEEQRDAALLNCTS